MTYLSFSYFVLVAVVFTVYYILPLKFRWCSLFAGSIGFYFLAYREGWWMILLTAGFSFIAALLIEKVKSKLLLQKLVLAVAIILVSAPWFLTKSVKPFLERIHRLGSIKWVIPMGISFYTLQIIAYLVDVFREKYSAARNPFQYLLYIIYFPQILQGPIPRYEKLSGQLYTGNIFDEELFLRGIISIFWGFFLKLMIADKASIIVDPIFNYWQNYRGTYVIVGGILYSIQLYTDFQACTSISKGVSLLFGITLDDNFAQPYFATSIKDFWRRWHISLSLWLRDYIYIPLGGSRKGRLRKYVNLTITFLVSGIWHGSGFRFIAWGLLHATLQIFEDISNPLQKRLLSLSHINTGSAAYIFLSRTSTFFCVAIAWVIFRANSLRVALRMLKSVMSFRNPWILTDDSLLYLGLSWKNWSVLLLSIAFLYFISKKREQGVDVAKAIIELPLLLRWGVFLSMLFIVVTFGTYGTGFNAQAFIYGGF